MGSNLDSNPLIRSMDFTETFHEEETDALTAEEKQEAEQLQKDEQLRRNNPVAYHSLMAKRRNDELRSINAANLAKQRLTEQRTSLYFASATTTKHAFPALSSASILPSSGSIILTAIPSNAFQDLGSSISNASPDRQSVPAGLSVQSNLAPSPPVNDPVSGTNAQPPPVQATQNGPDSITNIHSNPADIDDSILDLQNKLDQSDRSKLKRKHAMESNANIAGTSTTIPVDLSPILGAGTTVRPLETHDDLEIGPQRKSSQLHSKASSSDSEPAPNLAPVGPLRHLLNKEHAKMLKQKARLKDLGKSSQPDVANRS